MSKAEISYGELSNASKDASKVAKKLEKYADNLSSEIYNHIQSYSGRHTEHIESAKSRVKSKIDQLRGLQTAYETYSTDLIELKRECKNTDL